MKGKVARPEVLVVSRVDKATVRFSQVVQIFRFHCWGVEMFNSLLNTYQRVDFVQQRRSENTKAQEIEHWSSSGYI